MTVPLDLRGSYHSYTDHLHFNRRIPDEFPFIDYAVRKPAEVAGLAFLIEEFFHRCQWAATPFGLVLRAACLVQARETIRILRRLAAEQALRLPTPWLEISQVPVDDALAASLRRVKALEVLRRYFLGIPLGRPGAGLNEADICKRALTESSPLSFGDFSSWPTEHDIYRADGSPILNRSTRGILESHASAYAVELLRSCSPRQATRWLDEHVQRKRIGLYKALEELTGAADISLPLLGIRHLLQLADLAINVPVADIYGFAPPPDYIESMLPYTRYTLALGDVADAADAMKLMMRQEPGKYAGLDAATRIRLVVETALRIRGQASLIWALAPTSRRPAMESNIAAAWQWDTYARSLLDSVGDVRFLEEMLISALSYSSIRFFKINAEMSTASVLFEPTVDRFINLVRFCDWPVVDYDGHVQVFFCDPTPDPRPILDAQVAIYELLGIVRRLLTEHCRAFDGPSWSLSRSQEPLMRLIGVRAAQLST